MSSEKEFIPNIMSRRNKKVVKYVCPLYKPEVEVEVKNECEHNFVIGTDIIEKCCTKCHVIETIIINTIFDYETDKDKKDGNNILIWDREHNRKRFSDDYLYTIKGCKNDELSDQSWSFILKEVPSKFKWVDVFNVFKKYRIMKYWMGFGRFIGLDIGMNKTIFALANQYTNLKKTEHYRVNHVYLLYKFTQLYTDEKGSEQNIPMKMSEGCLRKTDEWWKKICEENGFEYMDSEVHEIEWDKAEQVKLFTDYLDNLGLNSNI